MTSENYNEELEFLQEAKESDLCYAGDAPATTMESHQIETTHSRVDIHFVAQHHYISLKSHLDLVFPPHDHFKPNDEDQESEDKEGFQHFGSIEQKTLESRKQQSRTKRNQTREIIDLPLSPLLPLSFGLS